MYEVTLEWIGGPVLHLRNENEEVRISLEEDQYDYLLNKTSIAEE